MTAQYYKIADGFMISVGSERMMSGPESSLTTVDKVSSELSKHK